MHKFFLEINLMKKNSMFIWDPWLYDKVNQYHLDR